MGPDLKTLGVAIGRASSYRMLAGTGGIGSGLAFDLEGGHTLGREESRAARLRPSRDFCKLHIISHYVAVLLGPGFTVLPVGAVGADGPGREARALMAEAGMDVSFVAELPGAPSLFSVCFQYPDGAGGNLTTSESASALVTPAMIAAARPRCEAFRNAGIALAAPEVPLSARLALLDIAGDLGFLRVAAVVSGEAREALGVELFRKTDLLSLNQHEARALVGAPAELPVTDLLPAVARLLTAEHPGIDIVVTAGPAGAHGFSAGRWRHVAAVPATVASTAGAGDAFLAGLIVGRVAGLPFDDSLRLAALLASAKLTSPDTIHLTLDAAGLRRHARAAGVPFPVPGP